MKLLLLVLFVSVALAAIHMPRMKHHKASNKDSNNTDANCGLYAKKKFHLYKPTNKASFYCEMCYDLISVFEMYADCDEAYQDQKADESCDAKYLPGDPMMDKICRQAADDLYKDMRNDTDTSPDKECSKILHATCNSTAFEFYLV